VREATGHGAVGSSSVADLVAQLARPRAVWVMVPAGAATQEMIDTVARHLDRDDIVIDGGNTNFHDDVRRAEALKQLGLRYMDVGTSGGIWGLQVGYCLMVGGDEAVFQHLEPLFRTLAPENGYGHMGAHGAGHYVKMVHNGIEYGMMQAIAEGFSLLHKSPYGLDLARIAALWMPGSVVRSWLVELAAARSRRSRAPEDPRVGGGLGRGAVDRAGCDRPVGAGLDDHRRALHALPLREDDSFADRMLAALRNQFGGHAVEAG
jgi:6-phosphogluconate dehydrogenase